MISKELYDTLGVDPSTPFEEIKSAYRKLVREHHPDRGGDVERMQNITNAYSVLRDPELRSHYDKTGQVKRNEADAMQQAVIRFLVKTFEEVMKGVNGGIDLRQIRVVEQMKERIQERLSETEKIQDNLQVNIAILQKVMSKTKIPEGGKNLFISIINTRIADMQTAFDQNKNTYIIQQMAMDEMAPYSSLEDYIQHIHIHTVYSTSTSNSTTTGW